MVQTVYILINHVWHCIYLYAGNDDDQINIAYRIAHTAKQWYCVKLIRSYEPDVVKISDY